MNRMQISKWAVLQNLRAPLKSISGQLEVTTIPHVLVCPKPPRNSAMDRDEFIIICSKI